MKWATEDTVLELVDHLPSEAAVPVESGYRHHT